MKPEAERQTDRQDRIHRRYREIEKQTIEGQGDKTHRWESGGRAVRWLFLFSLSFFENLKTKATGLSPSKQHSGMTSHI